MLKVYISTTIFSYILQYVVFRNAECFNETFKYHSYQYMCMSHFEDHFLIPSHMTFHYHALKYKLTCVNLERASNSHEEQHTLL